MTQSKDFCVSGTRAYRDDCQTALEEVKRLTCLAIDVALKAQMAADPVSELLIRRLQNELQAAYSTASQLHSARNAHGLEGGAQ